MSCSSRLRSSDSRRSLRFWRACRIALFIALIFVCVGFPSAANAQQAKPQEYQVKAVYLYNFSKFVTWPANSIQGDTFTVCVLGPDPFGPFLDTTLANETIGNRPLVAKRISDFHEISGCQILFISASEAAHVNEILSPIEKSSVLTVSDIPSFTNSGGMIGFELIDNRVRFDVNLAAAEKAGLTLSSQLLKVATDVKNAPGAGGMKP
jgi:vacuolar-type H+-ATPase subunit F/Vma7